ncbi:AMP-binding protein [Alphaproteobacteria bacterium]|nr:AMP-binding protein [Alphaproteobacteria bacterium]
MRLFKSFNKYKNNIAIIDKEYFDLSYKRVLTETNKIKKKIENKSLILIVSENSLGSLLAYIFCIINNHVGIILDSKTTNQNILKIFKNYQPNFIFLSKKTKSIFKKICSEEYTFFDQSLMKNKIIKKKKLNKNLSLLLSTSGSMGSIKFVKLSKSNLKHNTDSIISYLKINSKDSTITNLPISYSYMLSIINTHFEVGASIIISKHSLIEKEFWKILKNSKVTSFNGVPYTYEILTKIGLKNIKIDTLKYLTHAGGKLEKNKLKEIIKFCKKNSLRFFSMYGQTEASPRISYLKPEFSQKKIGSIGKGIPGSKIYIIDSTSKKILKPFVEGEIICEGKNVFMGYSNNYKDLKKANEENYRLKTGDLGFFDKNGFFFITSRISKIAKIFGNRVDLGALESLMSQKGYKVACLSDNKKVFIFIEKKYNKTNLINTISKITNLNINSFELTKLKNLPRTANNKISYHELKNRC